MTPTLYAIKKGETQRDVQFGFVHEYEIDYYWGGPDGQEDFYTEEERPPRFYCSLVEVEIALTDATDAYGPEGVQVVTISEMKEN